MIRLGIIGLGYIGQIHLRHSLRLSDAKVLAVADLSKKALAKAHEVGIKKIYVNYDRLLEDPDIDAVVISLPTHLHLQCARRAAEAGKHIFLEKPMARNTEEAKEILSVAARNSVKLMMGYPLRFNTEFIKLKEKIRRGLLGDVVTAYASYISTGPFFHRAEGYAPVPVPEWWFNKELTGGGVLIDLGSHIINLLRWYFGEVQDIRSQLTYRLRMDFEDGAICLARFTSGTSAIINVGWFSQAHQLRVELSGSVENAIADHSPPSNVETAIQLLTSGVSEFLRPHFSELQYFASCIAGDHEPSPSGIDGVKDMETISAAYANELHFS
jgi:predicted dehydrogenase